MRIRLRGTRSPGHAANRHCPLGPAPARVTSPPSVEWKKPSGSAESVSVVIWLGYAIWWEHPGAGLGCFLASLAMVGTWGDQPPSGVVGGGPRATRRCHRRCSPLPLAGLRGPFFFPGGWFWWEVARSNRRGTPVLGPPKLRKPPPCV
jgi:hypothetical protein